MTIFFTGDHHFNHKRIIEYAHRPFANIEEMDTELIGRWNEVVGLHDVVYHLGDFCFGGSKVAQFYFFQLNGQIQILGYQWHHDKRWLPKQFGSTSQIRFGASQYYSKQGHAVGILPPMEVLEFKEFGEGGFPKAVVLCHYQINRWDRRHYNSWHLFGHSHGKVRGEGLSMDVGVDNWDFYPISLNKVVQIMRKKEIEKNENNSRANK